MNKIINEIMQQYKAGKITVEEANTFLEATKKYAAHIAPAVSLCVLSPVVLLWFCLLYTSDAADE